MKKIISTTAILSIILVSCGAPVPVEKEKEKIPFSVTTTSFGNFPETYEIEKTGRLTGSSIVTLTSQGVGRVDRVLVREGATVKK